MGFSTHGRYFQTVAVFRAIVILVHWSSFPPADSTQLRVGLVLVVIAGSNPHCVVAVFLFQRLLAQSFGLDLGDSFEWHQVNSYNEKRGEYKLSLQAIKNAPSGFVLAI